jgi:uncharacterized DUF497 family protein
MDFFSIFWDLDQDPTGNVQHIAENDLTKEDVEAVLVNPTAEGKSRSSGRASAWGYTPDGRYIMVVYEIEGDIIRPVTAYEVEEP